MIHPFKTIRLFIDTAQKLTAALVANTAAHTSLRERLDTIANHSGYLVRTKRAELQRAGHKVE